MSRAEKAVPPPPVAGGAPMSADERLARLELAAGHIAHKLYAGASTRPLAVSSLIAAYEQGVAERFPLPRDGGRGRVERRDGLR